MSDYLFDKKGEPDPEIERLESQLRPFAYRGRAPRLPRRRRLWIPATLLAAAAAVVALAWLRPVAPVSWTATVKGGVATADGRPLSGDLAVGVWLETGASQVLLRVGEIGTVELSPGTRARIVTPGAPHRLELGRGKLSARIQAPPRQLVIETPRSRVVDLGCAFELTVDESGRGRVVVTEGAVALSSDGAPEITVRAGSEHELVAPAPPPPVKTPPVETPAPPRPQGPKLKVSPPKPPAAPAPPPKKIEPVKKPEEGGLKLKHDSLRDLEGSAR